MNHDYYHLLKEMELCQTVVWEHEISYLWVGGERGADTPNVVKHSNISRDFPFFNIVEI
jgi:hypothetical protein